MCVGGGQHDGVRARDGETWNTTIKGKQATSSHSQGDSFLSTRGNPTAEYGGSPLSGCGSPAICTTAAMASQAAVRHRRGGVLEGAAPACMV